MKNKTKAERTEIALKAVASRRRNEKKRAKAFTKRAKLAWVTRRKVVHGTTAYKSKPKFEVKDAIIKMLLSTLSPKNGFIPTLPDLFDFEKRIIKLRALKGLMFLGFEFPYNLMQGKKRTHKKYEQQLDLLKANNKLSSRVFHSLKNINERLMFSQQPDQFAHIFTDYCGTIERNKEAVIHMLKYDLVVNGGLIWLTFNTRDNTTGGGTEIKLKKLIAKYGGNRYKYEPLNGSDILKYQGSDSGLGAPMLTLVIRRVK